MSTEKKTDNNETFFAPLTDDRVFKGKTLDNVEQRCLELCQAYIGGSWANAKTIDDIVVKRITGGLTNQLYRVRLGESVMRVENVIYPDEPVDVAVKFYQSKYMKVGQSQQDERLDDIIILTVLSELGISPRVFGIFNDGTIQDFVEHEHFRPPHQQDPAMLKALAELMAKIHHRNVPIRKNDTWPVSQIEKMLNDGYADQELPPRIEANGLIELPKLDLREEYVRIQQWLKLVDSPVVFSHNDYIGTNVLVTKPEGKLTTIDFEYSSYFARAWDITAFHAQWGIEPFDYDNLDLPEDSVLQNFIQLYIEGCEKESPGYAAQEENAPAKILREVKVYMLLYYMYLISFVMSTQEAIVDGNAFDPDTKVLYVERNLIRYLGLKERLIKDGTLVFK